MIELKHLRSSSQTGGSFIRGSFMLDEKHLEHFKLTSKQYEQLYCEYLEKYILTKRELELMIYKQRRINAILSGIAWAQAKYD